MDFGEHFHLTTFGFSVVAVIIFLIVYRSYNRESEIKKMARNTRKYVEEVGEQAKSSINDVSSKITGIIEGAVDAYEGWMDG